MRIVIRSVFLFTFFLLIHFVTADEVIKRNTSWTFARSNDPVIQITNRSEQTRMFVVRLLFGTDSYRYPADVEIAAGEKRALRVRDILQDLTPRYPDLQRQTAGVLQLEFEGTDRDVRTQLINRKRGARIEAPPAPKIRTEPSGPVIVTLDPQTGSAHGGYKATVKGRNFKQDAVVNWNGNPLNAQFVDSQTLVITVPSGPTGGTVAVEVKNTDNKNVVLNDAFRYKALPQISSVDPDTGLPAGGFTVTVYGSNFDADDSVLFGNRYGQTTFVNPGALAAVVPPAESGAVDVSVTSKEGDKDTLPQGFLYNNPPRIISMQADPNPIVRNTTTTITVKAEDSDADPLTYEYRVAQGGGTITGQNEQGVYRSPNTLGKAIIQVTVYDQHGARAQRTIEIEIQ